MTRPPYLLQRRCLYWLEIMIGHYRDIEALRLLHWQACLGPYGIAKQGKEGA